MITFQYALQRASLTKLILIIISLIFLFGTTQTFAQTKRIEELKREIGIAYKTNNLNETSKLYYSLAGEYRKSEDIKSTVSALEEGIKYSAQAGNVKLAHYGYYTLGLSYLEAKNYNSALKNLKKSLEYSEKLPDKQLIAQTHLYLSSCYQLQQKNKRAIDELDAALEISLKNNLILITKECYTKLADIYAKEGENAKSIEYRKNLDMLESDAAMKEEIGKIEKQISVFQNELDQKDQTLLQVEDSLTEMQQISSERQLQIDLLSTERELNEMTLEAQQAEIVNNRLTRNFLVVGVLLSLAFISVVLIGYRNKIKINKKIHDQNMNIKSSINYAQRIQMAMLPQKELIKELIPESFVYFLPRDIVSGDFYWIKKLESSDHSFAIAAVDCTGHGVPGAFMSMIGMNALNSIVGQGTLSARAILSKLHFSIYNSLKQDETGNKDGMDLALCTINISKKKLSFSGAKNHLIYLKNGELTQIRGDKHPIGGGKNDKLEFAEHDIILEGDMSFYLYSDGYVDQFGGVNNQKFMSKKLKELIQRISHLPMNEQKEKIEGELIKWKGDAKQIDDILVIGFKLSV